MITKGEEDFLKNIPISKKTSVNPFDPKSKLIAEQIISKLNNVFPELKVLHMGASALGISGQNDIDIYILCEEKDFDKYFSGLEKIFGKRDDKNVIQWSFKKDGFDIELYLTDPNSPSMQRQIKVFEILKPNKELLKEYEKLKESMNGKSFREYQRKKYEFYNKILTSNKL